MDISPSSIKNSKRPVICTFISARTFCCLVVVAVSLKRKKLTSVLALLSLMVNGKSLPSSPFQKREEIFKFNNESQNTCENEIKTAVISQR